MVLGGCLGTDPDDGEYADWEIEEGGPPDIDEWSLTFADAFDRGSLDTEKWSVGYGWGRETDWTVERIEDSHVDVDDEADNLVLTVSNPDDYDGFYSGAVNTQDKHYQQHGYWEARVKIPSAARGLLPAFWMKPNDEDWPPEIDVLEFFSDTTTSHHNVHYEGCDGVKDDTGFSNPLDADAAEEFHVFGCEWNEEEVIWFVEDEEVARTSEGNGTDCKYLNNGKPFYTMLNVHVANYPWLGGNPALNDDYPYEYRIDWVRIWERA